MLAMQMLFTFLLRRYWAACIALAILAIEIYQPLARSGSAWLDIALSALFATLAIVVMMRVGMFGVITAFFVWFLFQSFPIVLDFEAWYSGSMVLPLAVLLALSFHSVLASTNARSAP